MNRTASSSLSPRVVHVVAGLARQKGYQLRLKRGSQCGVCDPVVRQKQLAITMAGKEPGSCDWPGVNVMMAQHAGTMALAWFMRAALSQSAQDGTSVP